MRQTQHDMYEAGRRAGLEEAATIIEDQIGRGNTFTAEFAAQMIRSRLANPSPSPETK